MKQIVQRTRLSYTTLHDRLTALQTKKKGEWIIRLEAEGEPVRYVVDSSKNRAWLSGIGSQDEPPR